MNSLRVGRAPLRTRVADTAYICRTCGVQFAPSEAPAQHCPICDDERQYVGWDGQQWTTLEDLRAGHRNILRSEGRAITGVGTEPGIAIAQRALLVQTGAGNVLWDCVTLIDEASVDAVRQLGGIAAIAISHPHYYSCMVEWSHCFGGVPIYIHRDDRQWVMRADPAIVFWEGETKEISDGVTLVRCGGHFEGAQVMHWASAEDGRGALFTGDVIKVSMDRRSVSFMYSYPNLIPLPAAAIGRIARAVESFAFERIYGAWWGHIVFRDAKAVLARSAERYLRAIGA